MSDRRKDDPPGGRRRIRTERLMEDNGRWYFSTREGTLEGPYADKVKAIEGLESYIMMTQLKFVDKDPVLGFRHAVAPTLH